MINWIKKSAAVVFLEMGSGHSESVYEACMALELGFDPFLTITRQVPCTLKYKEHVVGVGYIDILVDRKVVIELKAISKLAPKDEQQVRRYLDAMDLDYGLLINFGNDLEIVEVQKAGNHGETPSSAD